MVRARLFWLCAVFLGALVPGLLLAQQGTISGVVLDENTGDPLPGANVLVQGLQIGSATNIDGEFTILNVPVGPRTIVARFIGYKSSVETVNVLAGQGTELNFNLMETALTLDEIVVTGVGAATEKKKLGNTVGTINLRELEAAPVQSLSELLTGREPGVNVLPSGGLVGEGARIRIRGSASLSQSNEPLVYIDGVRVNNAGGFAGRINVGGGGVPSRLDDINPEAIERIEILKGAAAATLYGTQAANGIIQIFTKQGQFSKPRFTIEIEEATINFPDVYKPNAGFARDAETAATMSEVFGIQVQPFQVVERTNVSDLFATGLAQTYSMSVSGGGSGVTYFASARYQNTDGPLSFKPSAFLGSQPGGARDALERGQFSANVNIIPSNKLRIRLSTHYSNVQQETVQNNNNIFGVVSLAMFGKPEFATLTNPQGTVAFATVREATYQEVRDEVDHASLGLNTSYKFSQDLSLDATFGLDFTSQRSQEFRPFGWNVDGKTSTDVNGELDLAKREHKEWTLDVKGNWNRNFGSDLSSGFSIGFQGFISQSDVSGSETDTFPGPGLEVLDAGANQTTYSIFSEVKEAGVYFQEQVGFRDFIYFTAGLRLDANSAFGSEFNTQSYPKLGVSFVATDAFNMGGSFLSTLRLRAGWGKSGQQPGAFDQFTTFEPQTSEDGAGLAPENLGDPSIKPEISSEIELGFEAGLLNDRVGLEFTYWDRKVEDALIFQQFAPSGGFRRTQLTNIGQLDANGLEIQANFSVVRKESFTLDIFANGAFLDETLTSLGGAPEQKVSGSYSRIRNYLREGFAPGSFFGAKLSNDELPIDITGDNIADSREALLDFFSTPQDPDDFAAVLVDEDGDGDFLDHFLGKPTPDWQGAFGFNIGFMKHFRISSLFEYKAGNYQVTNLTDAFLQSHPVIGRNTPEVAATEAILLNPASTAEQRLDAALRWEKEFRALFPFAGLNTIENANFLAIRELSLSYDFSRSFARRLGVDFASFTISGRNLHKFTGYSGVDQEANWIGRNGTNSAEVASAQDQIDNQFLDGVEAFGLPLPREVHFKLRFGF